MKANPVNENSTLHWNEPFSFHKSWLNSGSIVTFEILLASPPLPHGLSLQEGEMMVVKDRLSLSFLSDQEVRTGWWCGNGRTQWHGPWKQGRLGVWGTWGVPPRPEGTIWVNRYKLSKKLVLWQRSIKQLIGRNPYSHGRPRLNVGRQAPELTTGCASVKEWKDGYLCCITKVNSKQEQEVGRITDGSCFVLILFCSMFSLGFLCVLPQTPMTFGIRTVILKNKSIGGRGKMVYLARHQDMIAEKLP